MVNYTCTHCGSVVTTPRLFPYAVQRIFDFVWRNPGCTAKEIILGVYGRDVPTNVVGVYLSRIKREIPSTLKFISVYLHPKVSGRWGRRTKVYYITPAEVNPRPSERIDDVFV